MIRKLLTGVIFLLSVSCLRENYNAEECRKEIIFKMEDVPYIFQGNEIIDYRPYYMFTENLNFFIFAEERLQNTSEYDYEYCRNHSLIPYRAQTGRQFFLFVANLYDSISATYLAQLLASIKCVCSYHSNVSSYSDRLK